MVHDFGEVWQMFANLQPGYGRCNGLELAADFNGCVGLEIEQFKVAWTTVKPDENARFCFGGERFPRFPGMEITRQCQAE